MPYQIRFKKLVPNAKLPTQGKPGDAAYDLYCVEAFNLHSGETKAVPTGLVLAYMPSRMEDSSVYLQIEGRSGIASKGVFPIGGVVDATYRGEIKVILHNGNPISPYPDDGIAFKAGDRIAQFVIRKIVNEAEMVEAQEVSETSRGSSGFGSTGS